MNLILREASITDSDQILQWRNDPDVRRYSLHSNIISPEEHQKWYQLALEREDIQIFILEEDHTPVGQIHLTHWYDELVISYSIDRRCRGRHLGQRLVALMEDTILNNNVLRRDGEYYVAYVKKDNQASRRVFEALNYQEEEQRKWMKYIKKIG